MIDTRHPLLSRPGHRLWPSCATAERRCRPG